MFTEITGAQVLLKQGGVFKPAKLYNMGGALFAASSGGYIRLYANGSTSKDKVHFGERHFDGALTQDRFGRLRVDADPLHLAFTPTTTLIE